MQRQLFSRVALASLVVETPASSPNGQSDNPFADILARGAVKDERRLILGMRTTANFVTNQRPENWRETIMLAYPNSAEVG